MYVIPIYLFVCWAVWGGGGCTDSTINSRSNFVLLSTFGNCLGIVPLLFNGVAKG